MEHISTRLSNVSSILHAASDSSSTDIPTNATAAEIRLLGTRSAHIGNRATALQIPERVHLIFTMPNERASGSLETGELPKRLPLFQAVACAPGDFGSLPTRSCTKHQHPNAMILNSSAEKVILSPRL